ncbi:unnamed protein product [Musa acuminata subsp. malaccensis]|uniref:(wild Malaysian banana) hypothetical protein n=1 Tax=Musa acuminata subsp. malaccensis TaxID=214687 RepID=A0A8D7BBW1_MUSAM|nr:unnamed protein product [Musa acuminata subsp. malaccensis]
MSLPVNAEGGVPGAKSGPGDFRLELDWIKAPRIQRFVYNPFVFILMRSLKYATELILQDNYLYYFDIMFQDASKEVTNVQVNDISAAAPDEEDEGSPISSSSLTSSNEEDGKTSIADEKKAVKNTVEDTKTEVDCSGPEKVLKKPDKILPCPRCNSMGTKFFYYNNYNVNQPRHFCKNCQRYWTAGGTMRNVPFGAGRRKRKSITRHADSGSTICQESREEPSRASSAAASNILENGSAENAIHKQQSGMHVYCNGLAPLTQLQCYPESSWSYPWRPAWSNVAAMEAGRFWGFTTWSNGTWNIPWVGSNSGFISSSSSSSGSGCSGNDSPMLGKHSRDATLQSEEKTEKSIWVPKTLRIGDPEFNMGCPRYQALYRRCLPKLTAKVACASHEAIRGKDQDCQHHLRLFRNPCCKYEKKVFVSKFLLQRKFIISSAVTGLANQQRKIQLINVEQKEWLRNSSTES